MSPLKVRWTGDGDKAAEWLAEAKRLMFNLKTRMKIGDVRALWDARTYRDGVKINVMSIFGQDIIDIVAPMPQPKIPEAREDDILLVFLANSETSFCVWKTIKSTLTIFSFNKLADYIEKTGIPDPPLKTLGSISASSPEYDFSVFLVDSLYDEDIDVGGNLKYRLGTRSYSFFLTLVSRNSYVYPGFDITAKQQYDYNIGYLDYSQQIPPFIWPVYICSGRHNWLIVNGVLRKNIEMWGIQGVGAKFRWDESTGEVWDTTIFPFDPFGQIQYYATIGCTKFIGRVAGAAYDSGNLPEYPIMVYGCWWYEPVTVASGTKLQYDSTHIKFGDVVVFGSSYWYRRTEGGWSAVGACLGCFTGDPPDPYDRNYFIRSYDLNSLTGITNFKVKTYDHLDNNDETFILFFSVESTASYATGTYIAVASYTEMGAFVVDVPYNMVYESGVGVSFFMCYRCKSGSLHTLKLAFYGNIIRQVVSSFLCHSHSEQSEPGCWVESAVTEYLNAYQGRRVFDPSCIIVDNFILYTYQIWVYTGPGAVQNESLKEADWDFEKRILGIIDIEADERKEYEVTEAMEARGVDWTAKLSSAIGVLKGKIKNGSVVI